MYFYERVFQNSKNFAKAAVTLLPFLLTFLSFVGDENVYARSFLSTYNSPPRKKFTFNSLPRIRWKPETGKYNTVHLPINQISDRKFM